MENPYKLKIISELNRNDASIIILDEVKQDNLVAGENIIIDGSVISAVGYNDSSVKANIYDLSVLIEQNELIVSKHINALNTNKQDKLTAGENIAIDASNNISAVDTVYDDSSVRGLISSEASTRALADSSLQEEINNLKARGRFLSLWNASTGLAESTPESLPYAYKTGDYYIVSVVSEKNYKPDGSVYTAVASTTLEENELAIDDVYYYDGSVWKLQKNTQKSISFANLTGQPSDNTNLKNALDAKQDKLTAGSNITIDASNKISATDTTYSAGTNVQINGTTISATDTTYSAGTNVQIVGTTISATDTIYDDASIRQNIYDLSTLVEEDELVISKHLNALDASKQGTLTAGSNITIDASNVISATNTVYDDSSVRGLIYDNSTAIANEVTNRTNAVNAEASARALADSSLQSNIDAKQDALTAGTNIQINGSTISATDTTYSAGTNVQINGTTISATDTTYTAGTNVQIVGTTISATDTVYDDSSLKQNIYDLSTLVEEDELVVSKHLNALDASKQGLLTAGTNITIDASNVISATNTTYTAGTNVQISGTTISATDTTYSAGTNVQINGTTISATDTVYDDTSVKNLINAEASTRALADSSLQDEIDNLKARGRFLSLWDASTGLASSDPETSPYEYKTGDYYIVGVIGSVTNYKPDGSVYVIGQASTTVESSELAVDDVYYYDGSSWKLQKNTQKTVSFANLAGQPSDNTNLKNALDAKQAVLTAGTNIQINGSTISATDTIYNDTSIWQEIYDLSTMIEDDEYTVTKHINALNDNKQDKLTAGSNITIDASNNISATNTTYTAGTNVQISGTTISATDTTYSAGTNVQINGTTISATDTTYSAGTNVQINGTTISATDTTYTAGTNVQINGTTISATDTTYSAGTNITIDANNVISATGGGGSYDDTSIRRDVSALAEDVSVLRVELVDVEYAASAAICETRSDVSTLTQDIIDNELIISGALTTLNANKQDKLVSGTNIKTINGSSIIGSGDIEVGSKIKVIDLLD